MSTFRDFAASLPPRPGTVRVVPGPIPEIVIDDPATKNALSPQMMVQLADAVTAVEDAAVVILRGEGGAFCSGGNLDAVRDHLMDDGFGDELYSFMADCVDTLASRACVVVAVLEGYALGGGAELLSAADFVYATPGARVGYVHAKMGVSPGFGGAAHLVHKVGAHKALQLLTDARVLWAAEAQAIGLVDVVADDALAQARAHAGRLHAVPPEVLRGLVRVVRDPASERAVFAELWGGAAHRAALESRRKSG